MQKFGSNKCLEMLSALDQLKSLQYVRGAKRFVPHGNILVMNVNIKSKLVALS